MRVRGADDQARIGLILARGPHDGTAVNLGHLEIRDNHVEGFAGQRRDSVQARNERADVEPVAAQE